MSGFNQHILEFEWRSLANEYRSNGMSVFTELFRVHPEYQKKFKTYGPKSWESLSGSVRLMCHSQYIMKAIGTTIQLAGSKSALDEYLHKLGGEHVERGVGQEHWENFFKILLNQLVISNAGRVTRNEWQKFFGHLTAKMTEGLKKPVKAAPSPCDEAIRDIFIAWDVDKTGALNKDDLFQVMANLDTGANEASIKKMIEEADENKDGKIQFDEFLAVFRAKRS